MTRRFATILLAAVLTLGATQMSQANVRAPAGSSGHNGSHPASRGALTTREEVMTHRSPGQTALRLRGQLAAGEADQGHRVAAVPSSWRVAIRRSASPAQPQPRLGRWRAGPAIEGGPCNTWMSYVRPSMGFAKVHRRTLAEIRCAVAWVHGVPGGIPMADCIAKRESGPYTWPWAENPSGSAGVFQFIPSTWASARATFRWLAAHTFPSVFSMRSNVLFFARYAHTYGLGAWGGGC